MSTAIFSSSGNSVLNQPRSDKGVQNFAEVGMQWAQRLWAAVTTQRSAAVNQPLTALQEAEQLRAMADDLLKSDPHLAQELYCAADRHEWAQQA